MVLIGLVVGFQLGFIVGGFTQVIGHGFWEVVLDQKEDGKP